ncbi:MAG: (Fe-S)-binding protein [Planctomycetes bacterium]|nr:(Fe-S)-binding protein [Planctomycetota bacterium]
MEFTRPIMWNVPHWAEITLYAMIPLVMIAFVAATVWRMRKWFIGAAEPGTPSLRQQLLQSLRPRQLWSLVKTALFQSRLTRDTFSLVMHQAIFWGMALLFVGTALATVDQDLTNLLWDWQFLSGRTYLVYEFVLDVFGVVLIVGIAMAAYRRYVLRPRRLQAKRKNISLWDAFPFLSLLLLIAVTGFLVEGLRIAEGLHIESQVAAAPSDGQARLAALERMDVRARLKMGPERQEAQLRRIAEGEAVFPAAAAAPVGKGIAHLLTPLSLDNVRLLHQLSWWVHTLLAFGLIVSIPMTKAFHLISSPANMLLRDAGEPGRLPVVAESGVRTVRDYTWRQLVQVDACTWCGKCQDVCPGYAAGFPLSPRDLVQGLGAQLLRTKPKDRDNTPSLHGPVVTPEELWACCTCRACEDICPVHIQQPRLIIDLRRHLIDGGQVDEGLQDALMNFQRYGNSFGQSPRKRADWMKPLGFKLKDVRKEPAEYLWFVGDYASYDPRAQEVTRAVARVLRHAGVDVGLLMEKEQNSGNDVRRIGEEGLFAMLRDKNGQELANAKDNFRRVLTSDPHTYNTLKNEYRAGGQISEGDAAAEPLAGKPVLHYAELLDELIRGGAIGLARRMDRTVTYHDPCYLGRFNGVYDAPRRILEALGARLVEMPRSRANSYCCGAGGGRVWMKDSPGIAERPAENRIKEALALPGVQCLVVACPKDLIMFQDAVKTVGAEDRLRVVDVGELVLEAMDVPAEAVT